MASFPAGGNPKGGGAVSGGMELIERYTVAGSAIASYAVTFDGSRYSELEIEAIVKQSGAGSLSYYIRPNNDSSSTYYAGTAYNSSTNYAFAVAAHTGIRVCALGGAGQVGHSLIRMSCTANTIFPKRTAYVQQKRYTSGAVTNDTNYDVYSMTYATALTSIVLAASAGAAIDVGSVLNVYGRLV